MSRRLTPKAGRAAPAMIGPNAVLQLAWAMERHLGAVRTAAVLCDAGLFTLPSGDAMIGEDEVIQLHHALARREPDHARAIAVAAGQGTADYIIANRIPRAAAYVLRRLPAFLAAPLLMRAIRAHAWTFVGAGALIPRGAWQFSINRADAGDDTPPPSCLYDWYGAVFACLYQDLVHADLACFSEEGDPRQAQMQNYRLVRSKAAHHPQWTLA